MPPTMKPAVALDLVSLFLAPVSRTLRGIDRVELAYARHFLDRWPGDCYAIIPTLWGIRFYERDRALRYLGVIESFWQENISRDKDLIYRTTRTQILGSPAPTASPQKSGDISIAKITHRFLRAIVAARFSFGRSVRRSLPQNTIYLNVGQLQIHRLFLRWLKDRPDIFAVFMVHDVTPIEYPVYHNTEIVSAHHKIIRNTAEFARAHIFPSRAARDSVLQELGKHNPLSTLSHVELLPVPDEFLGPMEPDCELASANYFIVCGAMDPHKNHVFVLEIWKELLPILGPEMPKLVFAGSPKLASKAMLRMLQDPALNKHVILSAGLSTAGMRNLMAHAKALLMPSMSEGFGLPIVEALAQNTPVIASDIEAHREAGRGSNTVFLPLSRKDAWISAVAELARKHPGEVRQSSGYKPKTWADYFQGVERLLDLLTSQKHPG